MAETIPMTSHGAKRLREELRNLREEELPRLDNATSYEEKERKGMIDARISYIEQTLDRAEIVDPAQMAGDKVQFSATVELTDVDSDKTWRVQIVGPEEADEKQGRISAASPLARALLGCEAGDSVKSITPSGERVDAEIEKVLYI
ncbi:GreA/GreB family elongation factor [Streptomyces sp. NPDC057245]|uniref:GreA/GreB family elongation factor n=1 Tax=Streptomyces sp. NPDC057245 TaxID=3346065 RepID=UPI00362D730B